MKTRAFLRCDRGSSIVEFALLAQTFAFLLIGLIEMGRYEYYSILAAHAARAGVQYGAQNVVAAADNSGMSSAAQADTSNSGFTVASSHYCVFNGAVVNCGTGEPPAGTTYYVQVKVSGGISSLFHYPGLPASLPLSATATLRVVSQ
jgi:Flp pilus assembly protein TadG